MARLLSIDTDIIRKDTELRLRLEAELCPNEDGCLLYPSQTITVYARGYRETLSVCVARVAWAFANRHDHLGVRDLAVHVCKFGMQTKEKDPRTCCNPEHLRKGDDRDIATMKAARCRGLVLEKP